MVQYQPSQEQRDLIADIDGALTAILPLSRLNESPQESAATWAALEDLGIFGLAAPEAVGGAALGAVEEVLLAAALGRRLASPSVFATLGAVHANIHAPTPVLKRTSPAYQNRRGVVVMVDCGATNALLLRTADSATIHLIDTKQMELEGNPWLDRLCVRSDAGPPIATLGAAGLLRLRLIDAAALAGIAGATLDAAAGYARMREQFGRPIGSFQAVKHHCANMAVAARKAIDLVTYAAVAADQARPDAAFLADSAFIIAAQGAIDNAGRNIQIHGGIGFSDEADAHLFLKRGQLLATIGGGVEAALERIAIVAAA
ncbi:acyl-CoA dehydrogenase family protein [Sphingobium sp. B2]|uniref:acyl-CoA dehydrogenase family protein n=1 Tax=Sphingobium sp. B2 TaxID=2583228 RepID=UPI0011A56B30|nr:acyl-CoA dehydrogenase family protein [Sphingobium sp. B2]